MTNRRLVALVLISVVAVGFAAMLVSRGDGTPGSTLSRGPLGWMAARRYLETRGVDVELLGHAEGHLPSDRTLVTVFPWHRLALSEPAQQVQTHLRRGGTVVVGYTGAREAVSEGDLLRALGIPRRDLERPRSLHPWRWREQQTAEWHLLPTAESRADTAALVRTMALLPSWPRSAVALRRNEDGRVLVARVRAGGGHLILLPAEALCNARLSQTGNADLLEELAQGTTRHWVFDEYHHGLTDERENADERPHWALLAWLVHLALCYVLVLVALARRFGPAWSAPLPAAGSARSFFVGVGALHARLGHASEAAAVLHARARDLDPGLDLPARPPRNEPMNAPAFLRWAQRVAHAQQRRRR